MNNADKKTSFDELVNLMLDGEATLAEQAQFKQHIQSSIYHSDCFQAEKDVQTFVKKHIERQAAPADLLETLQAQFQHQLSQENHTQNTISKTSDIFK